MNYNSCDRRCGYGDSTEEAAGHFFSPSRTIPWQVGPGPVLNPVAAAGNINCNAGSIVEATGSGQGTIIFQGFLGGKGYGGLQPSSAAALQARWDLNPGVQIMGENQTSGGNQIRDVDQEQAAAAKWHNNNMTPSTRLRGQLDDDELFGFSVDQRSGQPNHGHKIISPCTVVYKECQKNQALDSASHCVDGCGEFMRRGREGPESLQCMACGCHRSYHKSVRVGDNGKGLLDGGEASAAAAAADLHLSLSRIESVALNLMEATGRALPLLAGEPPLHRGSRMDDLSQKELDTVMKISIENLDHISKVTLSTVECIGLLQTAGNSTQQSANTDATAATAAAAAAAEARNLPSDHGRLSSEVSPVSTTYRRSTRPGQPSPPPGSPFSLQLAGNRVSPALHRASKAGNHDMVTAAGNGNNNNNNNNNGGKPKRKRTQFTDEQRGKLKAYAEHAGWTIVGQRKENIVAACQDIGVTPKTLKYWIHNAKQKLKRSYATPAT